MGLISRVSSRTYRSLQKTKKNVSTSRLEHRPTNHAYLVKSRKSGGVQFSKHPGNLKNKNTLKYSGIANNKAISIQAGADGITLKSGKTKATWGKHRGQRLTVLKVGNAVGKMNPALRGAAQKRVSALLRAQK